MRQDAPATTRSTSPSVLAPFRETGETAEDHRISSLAYVANGRTSRLLSTLCLSCRKNKESGDFFYMHDGLGSHGRALVIENIFDRIGEYFEVINEFLGSVFRELNATLDDNLTEQICGFFGGRNYQRVVRPSEAVDIHAGRCMSYKGFDLEENTDCPLKAKCRAYSRAKEETGRSTLSQDG